MKSFCVAAVLALLSVPAYAQMPNVNLMPEVKSMTPEEKEQDAVTQKAYRESLRKIPDTKASADPWGDVRSEAPKAATKTPAKRSRTSTAH